MTVSKWEMTPLFINQTSPWLEGCPFDMWLQLNYVLLLYAVGKILDKVVLQEYFMPVTSFFNSTIGPSVGHLLECDKSVGKATYNEKVSILSDWIMLLLCALVYFSFSGSQHVEKSIEGPGGKRT